MRLVQFLDDDARRRVATVSEGSDSLCLLGNTDSVRDLALEANRLGTTLAALVEQRTGE